MDTLDDAPDPDGRDDCFAPPAEPCDCFCLHCQRVVNSGDMWFQRVVDGPPDLAGYWMCPTPNCGGAGFTFDLHPTDPDHPANADWSWSPDPPDEDDPAGTDVAYDPAEPQYAEAAADDDDDDLEGEEWKHGLAPGERPAQTPEQEAAWAEWEAKRAAEERKYDEPDRRPRTVDGSHMRRAEEATPRPPGLEDDIPF